jgi:hypothetical protein
MRRFWQAVVVLAGFTPVLRADEGDRPFAWAPLKVPVSAFTRDLGMLDAERDEYATNLANCAASGITQSKASPASLERGQRLLAVALNLSPRNRRAIIVNFQLAKGMLPDEVKGDYSPQVLARLLLTRGQLLFKTESQENRLLARMFFQLAAELDPKNEDAVYASEVDRLDHGNVDWTYLTRQNPVATPEAPKEPAHPRKESLRAPGPPRRP